MAYANRSSDELRQVVVIGDGAMGTLCASMLNEKTPAVRMWSAFPQQADELGRDRENKRFLPGFSIPTGIEITASDKRAFVEAQLIISAVPCQHVRSVWSRLAQHTPRDVPIVSAAKGIEIDTLRLPTQIIEDCLGKVPLIALSGPCIASEVAACKPATVVAAAEDPALATLVQLLFSNDYFRVYTSNDLLGVELAGAVKNVIALAAGICDGLDVGCNAKASLLTRGLVEITRLGAAMGAHEETFMGLAGLGDLVTTCISAASRNRTAGEKIGRGMRTCDVIESTPSVIEGIPTTQNVIKLAKRFDVEMPITEAVAAVLFCDLSPGEAIHQLMTRTLKPE